jgi:hypothetical protein
VIKQFKTADAFKKALEDHLRRRANQHNIPLSTMQLKFVIERLLARLFRKPNPPWLLKGGFAMDLRFRPRARTTKDVDLSVSLVTGMEGPNTEQLRELLQEAVDVDLGDYLSYRIGTVKKELTNAPGGGGRFPCEVVFVGKIYARFHIDVGFGDAVVGTPDPLTGEDLLDFIGVSPAMVLAIPKPQQFAEKIHAYTFPWGDRLNTRTKDLVDLVLLIERGGLNGIEVREAIAATFATRGTHPIPTELNSPPLEWKDEFIKLASEAKISTTDYLVAFELLKECWLANALGQSEI